MKLAPTILRDRNQVPCEQGRPHLPIGSGQSSTVGMLNNKIRVYRLQIECFVRTVRRSCPMFSETHNGIPGGSAIPLRAAPALLLAMLLMVAAQTEATEPSASTADPEATREAEPEPTRETSRAEATEQAEPNPNPNPPRNPAASRPSSAGTEAGSSPPSAPGRGTHLRCAAGRLSRLLGL